MLGLVNRNGVIPVVALLFAAWVQARVAPPVVEILLEKSTVTEHEPVLVDITIQNSTVGQIDFDPGYEWENIRFKVVDPSGHSWERPTPIPQEGMKFSNEVRVPAGATETISVPLSEWFSFKDLGLYEIDVTPGRVTGGTKVPTTKLWVRVQERDEAALNSACSELLERVDSKSFTASLVAAKALSEINDPVAIPYLSGAMKRREFVSLMIRALARLNTTDSVGALIQASRSQDRETSDLAKAALGSIRKPAPAR